MMLLLFVLFAVQTEEVSHELDWSKQDCARLDGFIMGRCVRRSVLEEAFGWVPDKVAAALSKMDAASAGAPAAATKAAKDGDATADVDKGGSLGGAAVEATEEGQGDDGERWVTGEAGSLYS